MLIEFIDETLKYNNCCFHHVASFYRIVLTNLENNSITIVTNDIYLVNSHLRQCFSFSPQCTQENERRAGRKDFFENNQNRWWTGIGYSQRLFKQLDFEKMLFKSRCDISKQKTMMFFIWRSIAMKKHFSNSSMEHSGMKKLVSNIVIVNICSIHPNNYCQQPIDAERKKQ